MRLGTFPYHSITTRQAGLRPLGFLYMSSDVPKLIQILNLSPNLLDYTAVLFQNKNSWDTCCDMELQSIWTIAYGWYLYIYICISIYVKSICVVCRYYINSPLCLFFSKPWLSATEVTRVFLGRWVPPLHWASLPYLACNSDVWNSYIGPWNSHRCRLVGTSNYPLLVRYQNHGLVRFFGC